MRLLVHFLLIFAFASIGFGAERKAPTAVSLAPALTETVFQLGAGDSLIGRSDVCNYPEEARRLPVVGRFADPELEKVIRLRPNVLLANDLINPGLSRTLEQNGIRTLLLPCRSIEDYKRCVTRIGEELDCREAAVFELKRCDAELDALRNQPQSGMRVLWVIWDAPLMVAGGGSFPESLIELAGAENAAKKVKQEYFKCSYDWLLRNQPDAIIWSAQGAPDPTHRVWGKLRAVRRKHVVSGIDPDLIQRPGPRMFDGIKAIRRQLDSMLPDKQEKKGQ